MQKKLLISIFMCLVLLLTGCSNGARTSSNVPEENDNSLNSDGNNSTAKEPILLTRTIPKDASDLPKIETSGTDLVMQGKPFKFIGANAPDLVKYNEYEEYKQLKRSKPSVQKAIHNAKTLGITVLRIYIDWKWTQPEEVDYILDVARQEGVYILPTFDFGDWRQKTLPYINLNKRADIEKYKRLIAKTLNRKNSINGKLYKEDTTIIAWDIANEPNFSFYTRKESRDWLEEITTFYKSIDSNHLITIGIYPVQFKDLSNGITDYASVFDVKDIDFFSFHHYPTGVKCKPIEGNLEGAIENWGGAFLPLGKPVVLEEYGVENMQSLARKYQTENTVEYINVLKRGFDSTFKNGLAGVLFWEWGEPVSDELLEDWNASSISIEDKEICKFIQEYEVFEK